MLNDESVDTPEDIKQMYGIENMRVVLGSNKDWYLIYGEDSDGNISIQDLAIIGTIHAKKENAGEQKSGGNSKLATLEAAEALYDILIKAGRDGKDVICNATRDTSLVNIKRMLRKGLIKTAHDFEGNEIIWDSQNGLIYAETGQQVNYRQHDEDGEIQLLDLVLEPNVEALIQENEKTQELLERIREMLIMKGKEKEEGLDELRRTIRADLEDDER